MLFYLKGVEMQEVRKKERLFNKSEEKLNKNIRWSVFIPSFIFMLVFAIYGIINSDGFTSYANSFFDWSLDSFGWLYQLAFISSLIFLIVLLFSKKGNIRIGGEDAKPKYKFLTWFSMVLIGGVATGIVTWGVNEPLIYYGNIYGELNTLGVSPFSNEAARFAMGRAFYNWSFFPYSVYTLSGLLTAYVYYNKKKKLSVTSTLEPILGDKLNNRVLCDGIDILALLGNVLGLCSGLGTCIIMITTGLHYIYNIPNSLNLFIIVGLIIVFLYTFSTYIGMDKGLKKIAGLNSYFYYGFLILLFIIGPTLFILKNTFAGFAEWLNNFWLWALDPNTIGGKELTQSWTLYNWSYWIAFAPVMGIFLGQISYGRTIREFITVNLIMPAIFGLIWFGIWGSSAIFMQSSGNVDLANTVINQNAVTALWQFLENLPFNLGKILIPINIFVIVISFVTAADATSNNVASICVKDIPIGSEAPGFLKASWGIIIGIVAIILAAFGGTEQGVEGIKAVSAAGGFFVLFLFILQIISAIKMFYFDNISK